MDMRVFVTGASGWIGSAAVPELLEAGHRVVGLARSDNAAARIGALGAEVVRGGLDDIDSLRTGAAEADGVLHLGFKHDFSDMAGSARTERAAVGTMLETLEGSNRPFLFASGVAMLNPGAVADEETASPFSGSDAPRGGAEALALSYADRGVRPVALRFAPTVHGNGDHGFIAHLTGIAREKGLAGYVGDGDNRWAAVHRFDAGRVTRLALESAEAGSRVHAVAEEGIPSREIAAAIGAGLGVPVASIAPDDVDEHFGWIGRFFGMEMAASSALTRQRLGWTPTHPGLLDDLAAGHYFSAVTV
jgi:nucleoside-diphosphate-sugar epimerase